MDRFIIHFGEGNYLRDIDSTKNIITTDNLQESAIMSDSTVYDKAQYKSLIEILKDKSGWWEKVYIDIVVRNTQKDE